MTRKATTHKPALGISDNVQAILDDAKSIILANEEMNRREDAGRLERTRESGEKLCNVSAALGGEKCLAWAREHLRIRKTQAYKYMKLHRGWHAVQQFYETAGKNVNPTVEGAYLFLKRAAADKQLSEGVEGPPKKKSSPTKLTLLQLSRATRRIELLEDMLRSHNLEPPPREGEEPEPPPTSQPGPVSAEAGAEDDGGTPAEMAARKVPNGAPSEPPMVRAE